MSLNLKHIPCPAGASCTAFQCIFGHANEKQSPPVQKEVRKDSVLNSQAAPTLSSERKRGREFSNDDDGTFKKKSKQECTSESPPLANASAGYDDQEMEDGNFTRKSTTALRMGSEPISPSSVVGESSSAPDQTSLPNSQKMTPLDDEHSANLEKTSNATTSSSSSPLSLLLSNPDALRHLKSLLFGPTSSINTKKAPRKESQTTEASSSSVQQLKHKPTKISKPTSTTITAPANKKAETLNPRLLKSAPASHEIRLKLLKLLHQEMDRLNSASQALHQHGDNTVLLSREQLITHALEEEERTAILTKAVYNHVMKQKIVAHKRMQPTDWQAILQERLSKSLKNRAVSQESLNSSSTSTSTSTNEGTKTPTSVSTAVSSPGSSTAKPQLENGNIATARKELSIKLRNQLLKRLYTPVDTLSNHGYVPKKIPEEDIKKARQGIEASQGWEQCARCTQRFQVFPGRRPEDGALTSKGECAHHPGRLQRLHGDKFFSCCGQTAGESVGCEVAKCHVFKVTDSARLAASIDFISTPENRQSDNRSALALDCEMGYTTLGMEVIRYTLTSFHSGKVLLDLLVQPVGEILDLNTRFSGVSTKDFTEAVPWTTKLQWEFWARRNMVTNRDPKGPNLTTPQPMMKAGFHFARDLLLRFLKPETVLIGHGLENDLNSMRIIHTVVIDTVLLFPHHLGLPFRRKLATLALDYLGKTIQQSQPPPPSKQPDQQPSGSKPAAAPIGHDSAEDALIAAELVDYKLGELWKDLKMKGWKVVNDELVEPATDLSQGVNPFAI